jgi:putative protease
MELVAPAGNLEKLKYAYLFGADAVYIGLKDFSLRTRADNFENNACKAAGLIKKDKKLYAALNIYFHNQDLNRLKGELEYLAQYHFDSIIISDLGLVKLLQKKLPHTPLHLSTQANCINYKSAGLYKDLGFKRIILGRECSLKEIEEIKMKTDVEVEVFVHGAMCLAYSGRCFLSRYMAGRSANSGDCAHSCRWNYRVLEEEERPGEYFPVLEGDNFTSILSSRDLCMIDHLDKLRHAGVDAVKIEGRMKSVYYTAITTRAYRKALEALSGKPVENLGEYRAELFKVSHRELSTGFYFDREEIERPTELSYRRNYLFLGTIGKRVKPGLYALNVKNQIRSGETIEYIGWDILFLEDSGYSLFDEDFNPINKIDHSKTAYLKTDKPVLEDYIIRQKIV